MMKIKISNQAGAVRSGEVQASAIFKGGHCQSERQVCVGPILLQKSLELLPNRDSVVLARKLTGCSDDGAAQSGSGAAVLFL
jgi:hypothetical protein